MATLLGAAVDLSFIDLHCHVLPGVDDGPVDAAAAVELVRQSGKLAAWLRGLP